MMKISFLTLIFIYCLSGAFIYAKPSQPNLVFLLTDDQSTYTLGCYGNPDVKTPHIDKLSAEGVTFDNHYNTTAICMASRANIMTGMYEYKAACNFEHGHLLKEKWQNSYSMILRRAGYQTAMAGKIGFHLVDNPGDGKKKTYLPEKDFDAWGAGEGQTKYATAKNKSIKKYAKEYPHSTLAYGAFGADFIRDSAGKEKPFCLSISFKAPHKPATADPRFDHIYKETVFKKPDNYGRENGKHFSEQSKQGRQYKRYVEWQYDSNYNEVMRTYHQQVYAIDVAVGMIRAALEEHKVADNTVLIFTSDNGFFCGSHGFGSKVLPYDISTRVPMILYDPRHPNSGQSLRSQALTGNIDFAPTLLALAGLPIPDKMDGKNLMPAYDNPQADIHDSLKLINVWGSQATHVLSVVTKTMKYIYWSYEGKSMKPTEELYHLGKDPSELTNLAANPEFASQLNAMRQSYDKAVETWKKQAVPYHNYSEYGAIFERKF
ncbi:MAG: sulfatase [Verrucomicrobiota bacterium]